MGKLILRKLHELSKSILNACNKLIDFDNFDFVLFSVHQNQKLFVFFHYFIHVLLFPRKLKNTLMF